MGLYYITTSKYTTTQSISQVRSDPFKSFLFSSLHLLIFFNFFDFGGFFFGFCFLLLLYFLALIISSVWGGVVLLAGVLLNHPRVSLPQGFVCFLGLIFGFWIWGLFVFLFIFFFFRFWVLSGSGLLGNVWDRELGFVFKILSLCLSV